MSVSASEKNGFKMTFELVVNSSWRVVGRVFQASGPAYLKPHSRIADVIRGSSQWWLLAESYKRILTQFNEMQYLYTTHYNKTSKNLKNDHFER